jgi:hypothetical protein
MDIPGLEGLSEYVEDQEKGVEIYSAFLHKAKLEPEDREALKRDRGFSDETIDLCQFVSCSPKNREIIEELQKTYTEVDLVEAGILDVKDQGVVPCSQLLGIYNKKNQFVNNICIPYFNADGQPFYLRPHKFGFKGKGINVYVPVRKIDPAKPLILAESEFKAAAAVQFGFPAIGVPGIHSFAANHFDRLKSLIVELGISDLVVMYDNEIKNNPLLPNYKPEVLKQWDTQWRAIDISRKLIKALPTLKVKVAVLPQTWMVDGKIDIDGALAAKKSPNEFRSVVYKAYHWNEYLDSLLPVARKIIHRKIAKEDHLENSSIRKITSMGGKEGSIGYYIRKELKVKGEEKLVVWEPVTNFTMDIHKTVIDGEDYVREIVFRSQDGTITEPLLCTKGMNIFRDFKAWVWARGDFHFTGNQDDLDKIWRLEGVLCDGREIVRPEQIGFINSMMDPVWLFGNVLIKADGSMLTCENGDGVIWDGLVGYSPRSIREDKDKKSTTKSQVPIINLDPEQTFGIAELKSVGKNIEAILGTRTVTLALGWVVACLFSDEIFKKYASFPLLCISGKRESGKSTLAGWLMAMAGQAGTDAAGDGIGESTAAGVIRNLSWFSNLPYWLDEYRNDSTGKKWDSFLRNIYQRQGPTKGTLGKHIRSYDINACLMFSGEETPQDNALLSRCIVIPLTKRKKGNTDNYTQIETYRNQNLLSRLMYEVIKQRKKLLPIVLEAIDGCKKRLLKEGVGDRIALNYAIAAICYDIIFLAGEDTEVRRQYLEWVIKESFRNEEEKEREHMLAIFMDDLVAMGEDLSPHYMVYSQNSDPKGKRRIALHFPSFYNQWSKEARKKGMEPFKRQTILTYIRDEKYYIEDNMVKRIQGKPVRSLILSLDPQDNPPDALIYLAASVSETSDDNSKVLNVADIPQANDDLF